MISQENTQEQGEQDIDIKTKNAAQSMLFTQETALLDEKPFFVRPNSQATRFYEEILIAGEDIADIGARKKNVSHGATYEVAENGDKRQITMSSDSAKLTIEIEDIGAFTVSNKPAKKFFDLFLIKANEQAIHNGKLTRDYVSFSLEEVVSLGLYSSVRSAREGFENAADVLTSIKIKGKIQQTKKKGRTIERLEIPFTGARIEDNQCKIFLNYRIDWGFMLQYYTILPMYFFTLSNRAATLLRYIFYIARQRTNNIRARGYFTISNRAIQAELHLPSEVGNRKPKQQIKNPIEKAIKEIETAHRKYYNNQNLSLIPVYDENTSISDYLDNGYLKITLKGDFAKSFVEFSEKQISKIQAAEKRQKKIEDTAKAKNLAKKLEEQEQQGAANG